MVDYTDKIKYYDDLSDTENKKAHSTDSTRIFLRQRYPDVWAILGLGYFMILAILSMFIFLFTTKFSRGQQDAYLFRNILIIVAAVCWGIISPFHAFMLKHRHHDDIKKYGKMSLVGYLLEYFKLFQDTNNHLVKSEIYSDVAEELKTRESMRNKTGKEKVTNQEKIQSHKARCEELIIDLDNRLVNFVNSDFALYDFFYPYFKWSKSEDMIAGLTCGIFFMFGWNMPLMFPRENEISTLALMLNMIIPVAVGLFTPIMCSAVNFHWKKKALNQLLGEMGTEFVKSDSDAYYIENKIETKLKELQQEYVNLLIEMEDY